MGWSWWCRSSMQKISTKARSWVLRFIPCSLANSFENNLTGEWRSRIRKIEIANAQNLGIDGIFSWQRSCEKHWYFQLQCAVSLGCAKLCKNSSRMQWSWIASFKCLGQTSKILEISKYLTDSILSNCKRCRYIQMSKCVRASYCQRTLSQIWKNRCLDSFELGNASRSCCYPQIELNWENQREYWITEFQIDSRRSW